MCPRKNITDAPRPVFGLVSWICPDIDKLRCFTVRILILTCWSLNPKGFYLYNVYMKLCPGPRWRSSQRSSRLPKVGLLCRAGSVWIFQIRFDSVQFSTPSTRFQFLHITATKLL